MSSAVGTSNISFNGLQTAQNLVFADMSHPISLSEFRGKTFTDGTSVPGSNAISIGTDFRGKVFGSSSFEIETFSNGVSGVSEGAFPATSGQSYIFIYSKDSSVSEGDPESCTITFQTSSYTVNNNISGANARGGVIGASWTGDATTYITDIDTHWVKSSNTYTAHNVGTDSSYSYLWVTLTANMAINWKVASEEVYDELHIYVVGFFHKSTLTLGTNASGYWTITLVIRDGDYADVSKDISTSGSGTWLLTDGSFALNTPYTFTCAEAEGMSTSFTSLVGCTFTTASGWDGYATNEIRFTSAVSSFTMAILS